MLKKWVERGTKIGWWTGLIIGGLAAIAGVVACVILSGPTAAVSGPGVGLMGCIAAGIVGGVCAGIGAGIGALAYGVYKAGKAIGRCLGFGREENTLSRQPLLESRETQRQQEPQELQPQYPDCQRTQPEQEQSSSIWSKVKSFLGCGRDSAENQYVLQNDNTQVTKYNNPPTVINPYANDIETPTKNDDANGSQFEPASNPYEDCVH